MNMQEMITFDTQEVLLFWDMLARQYAEDPVMFQVLHQRFPQADAFLTEAQRAAKRRSQRRSSRKG